jgi:molecular chaperone GrpE
VPFDPSLHEAVTTSGDGDGELVVTDEFRRGYRLKDRVLRASLVGVTPKE